MEHIIRILGPTFSGSSDSLGRAIESLIVQQVIRKPYKVRVVSGSATDRANKMAIEHLDDPTGYDDKKKIVLVLFEATVNPDDLLSPRRTVIEQLRCTPQRVA